MASLLYKSPILRTSQLVKTPIMQLRRQKHLTITRPRSNIRTLKRNRVCI
nr:MAG TPA: hypothetical protein [Caudoviricetes sp.]